MSTHERADYEILIDTATHYVLGHAAAAGLSIRPPVWDDGGTDLRTGTHTLRIATAEAEEELRVPHEWLPSDSDGHGRFRAEVEAALARLQARARAAQAGRP